MTPAREGLRGASCARAKAIEEHPLLPREIRAWRRPREGLRTGRLEERRAVVDAIVPCEGGFERLLQQTRSMVGEGVTRFKSLTTDGSSSDHTLVKDVSRKRPSSIYEPSDARLATNIWRLYAVQDGKEHSWCRAKASGDDAHRVVKGTVKVVGMAAAVPDRRAAH